MTTSNPTQSHYQFSSATWKSLYSASFDYQSPFQLALADGSILIAEQTVRIVPKRRLVVFGHWQGVQVVAKLFFSRDHAARQYKKEIKGIQLLLKNNIPTPPLLYQGKSELPMVYVIITKKIEAKTLSFIWQEKEDVASVLPILKQAIVELATQHVLGIVHQDLHLKNFLISKKVIYTLDGAEIEAHPYLLPKKTSLQHLALFAAQFGAIEKSQQKLLLQWYAKSRGWNIKPQEWQAYFLQIKETQHKRSAALARKLNRDSTQFVSMRAPYQFGMVDRQAAGREMQAFLQNPDALFHQPHTLLKAGRSATVIKTTIDAKMVVIKRYNLKNTWHRLRRLFRTTRASHAWALGQKLIMFGVATPKPLAYVEKRWLNMKGQSYLVTEYIEATPALDYLVAHQAKPDYFDAIVSRIAALLRSLHQMEIIHGDLKITNILLDAKGKPYIIDLDGAKEQQSASKLNRAYHADIKRFLDNFTLNPNIKNAFTQVLKNQQ